MKLSLTLILLTFFSFNSWADCTGAYQKAAKRRDIRNEVIAVAAGVTAMAVAPTLFPTATIYFVGKYTLTVIGVVSVTELKRSGVKIYKNNFEKMMAAFEAAQNGEDNRLLNRLISRSLKKAGLDKTPEHQERAREIIVQAFNDETFCPERTVFRRSAVVDYVSLNLK